MVWYNPLSWYSGAKANSRKASSADPNKSISDTAHAVKDTTAVKATETAQQVENGAGATTQAASDSAAKVKDNRPGIKSHDSVGDRVRHAFRLDHKEHHKKDGLADTVATPAQ